LTVFKISSPFVLSRSAIPQHPDLHRQFVTRPPLGEAGGNAILGRNLYVRRRADMVDRNYP
jgi:hypothetical protein